MLSGLLGAPVLDVVLTGIQPVSAARRRKQIFVTLGCELCGHRVWTNVVQPSSVYRRIPNPTIVKAWLPNRRSVVQCLLYSMRRTTLNHLHCFFKTCTRCRTEQRMKMIRHYSKRM